MREDLEVCSYHPRFNVNPECLYGAGFKHLCFLCEAAVVVYVYVQPWRDIRRLRSRCRFLELAIILVDHFNFASTSYQSSAKAPSIKDYDL
jgi:hypothetical protein